jgi:hypothetical protein
VSLADGRHDFDFLHGRWRVHNRKVRDVLAAEPVWDEFPSRAQARPILGGLGNTDTYAMDDMPGRGRFHGFTVRLFDPASGLWRIWWASSAAPGKLDPPLAGRFADGVGHFDGDDVIGERPIKVHFTWTSSGREHARWEQAFSFDGGATYATNWTMEFTRVGERPGT